ncbi:hypothetical protein HY68_37375 [Streptomyces sp. AcH 505]|uniref:hypothetical protein n=1 Tax=Streptomyces sp. AcH 505 TaxID=352211 RepID=UPI00059239C8|nr:hypothetical protein HY68_37375 [Streptomyces sp. AcH 505]
MSTTTVDQPILSAQSFISSIGVNTHVGYAWGAYNNLALVEDDLKYLGVTSIRDGLTTIPGAQPVLAGLAAAGYKFDFVISSSVPAAGSAGLQQYLAALDAFEASHPGSIAALEGLNEANIQHFSFNGSSSIAAAAEYQKLFYTSIKGDTHLTGVPVYNLTLGHNDPGAYSQLGDLSQYSDYANAHSYLSTSLTTNSALESTLATASSSAFGKPIVITESGYTTQPDTPHIGADQSVQARSILNTLVDAYKDGVSKTYLYELLDRDSSPSNTDPEANYGLFNSDGTPKLAATAIHNLTAILADDGTGGHQPTGSLSYSLDNLPATGQSMVLGKSNGAYDLVVWAEPKIWDDASDTEISNPTQTVTVHLDSVHHSVKVYDPMSGTQPIAVYTDVKDIQIPVTDHPVVIEIDAPDTTTPPPTVPANVNGTAADIVAQLSTLNASDTLKTITLTDTHTLPVASEATMTYLITHYGKALAAIQGGYAFSVTVSTGGWTNTKVFDSSGSLQSTTNAAFTNGVITSKVTVYADHSTDSIHYTGGTIAQELIVKADGSKETKNYDPTGHLSSDTIQKTDGSSSTTLYSGSVKTKMYVANADGSHDSYAYNITGRSYTTELQHTDASGKITAITRSHADGSLDYTQVINSDGSKVTTVYDAAGHKTSAITVTTSATKTDLYNTSGALTKEIIQKTDGTVTTAVYTGAVLTAFYTTNSDRSTETKLYDSTGNLTTDAVQRTDGSSSTTVYSDGVKTRMYVTNADRSHDNYAYDIKGQAYTTELQHTDATGKVTAITRSHADGSLAYTQVIKGDGTRITDTYDSTGHKTSEVVLRTDGSHETDLYNASGELTQTIFKAADGYSTTTNYSGGHIASQYIVSADGATEAKLFDSAGQLTSDTVQNTDHSSSTTLYSNGVKTNLYVNNADGSHDTYAYNITGQTYTTEHQHADAAGQITAITRTHADGSLDYTQTIGSDGTKVTDLYDTAGHKTSELTLHTDGSSLSEAFNTSGSVTQTIAKTAHGDTTTTNYANNVKTSVYLAHADGSTESQLFDSTGHLTSDAIQNTDGSSSSTLYSDGVKTKMYITNTDGSHDTYSYNIKGQTYTTEFQHADASGKITELMRTHADGSLDYTQVIGSDGTKVTDIYDSSGTKTLETVNHASGSTDVYKYVVPGSPGAIQHEAYDSAGKLQDIDILNSNGTHNVTAVATGLTISGGAGNDVFSSAGSTTIVFDHGNDQIYNFRAGAAANHDTIKIAQSLVSDYDHLQMTQTGADTLIHISGSDSILLKNVHATNLSHADFLFT